MRLCVRLVHKLSIGIIPKIGIKIMVSSNSYAFNQSAKISWFLNLSTRWAAFWLRQQSNHHSLLFVSIVHDDKYTFVPITTTSLI